MLIFVRIMRHTYRIIGLMSGTSLDGLDVACCRFDRNEAGWNFQIEAATSYAYNSHWAEKLAALPTKNGLMLALTHVEYGHFLGQKARAFIEHHQLAGIDAIASHGHTIFHQPDQRLTLQIGHGAAIAAEAGIDTISDFRSLDVAHGGQGAPLVPIGDELLFGDYDACLNLGGFGNISFRTNGKRVAFDTGSANIVLNALANRLGLDYDRDGLQARKGAIVPELLEALNALPYFSQQPPKSLGREWVEANVDPLLHRYAATVPDLLHTVVEHTAQQIGAVAPTSGKMLVTGGGAHNSFLMERIRAHCQLNVVVPDPLVIEFKEALIFAFLGLLRLEGQPNCLASVTGATKDVCGGSIFRA